jgi:hypothetical protein
MSINVLKMGRVRTKYFLSALPQVLSLSLPLTERIRMGEFIQVRSSRQTSLPSMPGKGEVEDDEFLVGFDGLFDAFCTAGGKGHVVLPQGKNGPEGPPDGFFVVDDQYSDASFPGRS